MHINRQPQDNRSTDPGVIRQWSGRKIVDDLAARGFLIRSPSTRGVAEEAPGAYKDVGAVAAMARHAGLAPSQSRSKGSGLDSLAAGLPGIATVTGLAISNART
jgi:hypothetical protein